VDVVRVSRYGGATERRAAAPLWRDAVPRLERSATVPRYGWREMSRFSGSLISMQRVQAGRLGAMSSVIVIMFDGVSADHLARHPARCPHLAALVRRGLLV
jgi:hypothetical protein